MFVYFCASRVFVYIMPRVFVVVIAGQRGLHAVAGAASARRVYAQLLQVSRATKLLTTTRSFYWEVSVKIEKIFVGGSSMTFKWGWKVLLL